LVFAGHDEYWSKEQRNNVEAARPPVYTWHFFTGNEVYWKVRWEETIMEVKNRTLFVIKRVN
jgi:hypothetical protein